MEALIARLHFFLHWALDVGRWALDVVRSSPPDSAFGNPHLEGLLWKIQPALGKSGARPRYVYPRRTSQPGYINDELEIETLNLPDRD
jgi:hypothetical protein